jgi:hypothetical protein
MRSNKANASSAQRDSWKYVFLSLSELEMRNEPVLVLLIPPRERPAQIFFRRKVFLFVGATRQTACRTARGGGNESYPLAPALFEAHARFNRRASRERMWKVFSRWAGKIAEGKTGERKDKPCSYT